MVSKNITITEEAYSFLKKMKAKNKSFSEVILSLKEKRQDVMSYAGSLKGADLDSIRKIREEARRNWNDRSRH